MNYEQIMKLTPCVQTDALLAEKVMNWPFIGMNDPFRNFTEFGGVIVKHSHYNGGPITNIPQRFDRSLGVIPEQWYGSMIISDAWDILNLAPYFLLDRPTSEGELYGCRLNLVKFGPVFYAWDETASMAIGKAALLASYNIKEAIWRGDE